MAIKFHVIDSYDESYAQRCFWIINFDESFKLQFWTLCANLEINLITYNIDKDGVIL